MTHGEGATEGGTSLTIVHITVGKEDAALCREPFTEVTGLTHETVVNPCAINDGGAR